MIGELTRHLWQSTFFAFAAGLLTLAFRKNHAQVRYWLWLTASLKFVIPFAVLMNVGSRLETPATREIATRITTAPAIAYTVEQFSDPLFPERLPASAPEASAIHWIPVAILGLWLCGFLVIALIRLRSWLRVRSAVRGSAPINIPAGVEVRVSPGLLEPGVVGLLHPILLLPDGIAERLTPSELKAVMAHELCHVRRHDNLFASIHMVVETLFWFHPLVWWIGARLVEERERACDEEVLWLGNSSDVYADAILSVCKLYVESPLVCVSGVSGASIRRRIEAIMANRQLPQLNRAKKVLLATAGLAALAGPVAIGLLIGVAHAPLIHAQPPVPSEASTAAVAAIPVLQVQAAPPQPSAPQPPPAPRPKFAVASIRTCAGSDSGGRGSGSGGRLSASSGRLFAECQTLATFIRYAYLGYMYGETESHRLVFSQEFKGIPAWGNSERYTIEATGGGTETKEMILGPMLRSLLEDRFRLLVHRETRDVPVYDLTVAKGGPRLQAAREGSCAPRDPNAPLVMPGSGVAHVCGMVYKSATDDGRYMYGTTMARLCAQFSASLDRDVVDKTGLTGAFDIHLDVSPGDLSVSLANHTDLQISAIFSAITNLGLKLESAKGPGEFIVIDHVERASEN